MPHANREARRHAPRGQMPRKPQEICPINPHRKAWKARRNGAKLGPPMGRLPVLGAFCALLPCAACSSASAVDFDHGSGVSTAGGDTFGSGEARLAYPAPPYGAAVGATIDDFHFLG